MADTCHVCTADLVGPDTASCHLCYRDFHLAMTITSTVVDCGQIFMDNDSLALAFVCNACVEERPPQWTPAG